MSSGTTGPRETGALSTPEPGKAEAKVRKFPCDGCGASFVWSPGAERLKCPYCGAEKEVPRSAEAVAERPIEEALAARHDLGWGTARKTVKCPRCGARTTLEPAQSAGACAFCGTPAVTEVPADANLLRPEGILAFRIDRNTAAARFRTWLAGLWLRPSNLKSMAELGKVSGVYIPFWTFDAVTHNAWSAEAGTYYDVQVAAEENGRTVMRTERRVRWQPASGFLEKFFDDLPVAASRGLPRELARGIEPFPTADLPAYDPAFLSGFLAEEYAVGAEEALVVARKRMEEEIYAACAREVPGDTQRNLSVRSAFSGLAYKSALLPVWIAAYQYGGKPYRFLVNGVTGKVDGEAPFSWIKVSLLVLFILGLLLLLSRR